MLLKNIGLLTITFLCTVGCNTPEGHSWGPHVGFQQSVSSSMEISGLPGSSSSSEYSSSEVMVGGIRTSAGETRPIKHEFAGFIFGFGDITDPGAYVNYEGYELSGGGRFYMDEGKFFVPYFSVFTTMTDVDKQNGTGVQISPQLGIRVGVGSEFIIMKNVSLDLGADYLFPVVEFEQFGVEYELSGVAVRAGVSVGF